MAQTARTEPDLAILALLHPVPLDGEVAQHLAGSAPLDEGVEVVGSDCHRRDERRPADSQMTGL